MFKLEQAIRDWRRRMKAGGIKSSEFLDELESHLRDEVEQQMRAGQSAQQAFESAVARLGGGAALRTEFEKLRRGKPWRRLAGAKLALGCVVVMGALTLVSSHAGFNMRLGLRELLEGLLLVVLFGCLWRNGSWLPQLSSNPSFNVSSFSPSAKHSLELAREAAYRLGHDFVGTEHALLGLIEPENGIVAKALRRMGLAPERIREEIEKLVPPMAPQKTQGTIPHTPRAKRAFELAAQEAEAMKCDYVGTQHILLGLLREGQGVAALALRNLGVGAERGREAVLKEMDTPEGDGPAC